MNLAGRFVNPEKVQTVSKAFDFASQIASIAQNPREALEKAGITQDDIKKAQMFLDNPFASTVLGAIGANKQDMLNSLQRAESVFNVNTPMEQAPVGGELERLQETLAMLNK